MHGIIFAELKKYVDARLGAAAWDDLLAEAGWKDRLFLPVEDYPDEDAVKLVATAERITKTPAAALLEDFGAFIAPDLLRMYAALIRAEWRTLDVIEHTEETIHRVVRSRNPGAAPPYLRAERTAPDTVVVHYTSARRMCPVAKGIMRGLARHYGEAITLEEPECMLRGGQECRLVGRVRPAA